MFEEFRLLGKTTRSIVLQTHVGRSIENEIEMEPEFRHINKYNSIFAKHSSNWSTPGWVERKPPCGVYNCVGHVWASRRTSVFTPDIEAKISFIFQDDGYRVVNWPSEPLCIGDLGTYWESAKSRRGFYHVGVITELRKGLSEQSPPIPWLLSKWDGTSGEVFHQYLDHPLPKEVEVEFWTDRRTLSRSA
jgi:hypothetical protein